MPGKYTLLQKGAPITMQIAENEALLTTVVRAYTCNHNHEYSAQLADQKITGNSMEDCIQKVIKASHAKEFQLVPHSVEWGAVNAYLLLLKVNK